MKKSLLTGMVLLAALSATAEDKTYNFFDPKDCDADGWLWLDTPEKIAKYVGPGKKIQLIASPIESEDPEFPGETYFPPTTASATVKGYNTAGVEGGEGSKTGGIIMPQADEHGLWGTHGGGILVQMPDCATFDVYISQSLPEVYTWLEGGNGFLSAADLGYIWNEDEVYWDEEVDYGPLSKEYVAWYMNVQKKEYDVEFDGTVMRSIYGPKGEARTAALYNFSLCPMYIQGIRISTFTDVSLEETVVEPFPPAGTFNFFDPADCDAQGWLWFDTPEKIAKYIGEDKKIQLIASPIESEDPEFPGETYFPPTTASATVKGYNTAGVEGGEGSKTGGIIMPQADEHGLWGTHGGGILVQMPDCATFDVYISQSKPDVYTWIECGRGFFSAADLQYVWNEEEAELTWTGEGGPLSDNYVAWDMNVQDIVYDLNFGEGEPDNYQFFGPKGEPRTAAFYNYSLCPMYVQGIRISTFTDVSLSPTSVKTVTAEADIKIAGKVVSTSIPADIYVYDITGRVVASTYGTSLDCSSLKGIYIVRAAGKTAKVRF